MNPSPLLQRLLATLNRPVDIAALVFFRIFSGVLLPVELINRLLYGVPQQRIAIDSHFTYLGLVWTQPTLSQWIYGFYAMAIAGGVGVVLGLYYRVSAAMLMVGYAAMLITEKADYVNHRYLYMLVALILLITPAHRACSLDVWRKPHLASATAPAWALWLPLFQMCLVYFYAGVAKLDADWLAGRQMGIWLPQRVDQSIWGQWLAEPWLPHVMSWSGMVFDLSVAPLLLWRRSRPWAFAVAACFHLTNASVFGLATFPWFALLMTTLFFSPSWPRRLPLLGPLIGTRPDSPDDDEPPPPSPPAACGHSALGRWGLAALTLYAALQLALPLRHWAYPGHPSWNEEGHRFAWRMMIRTKQGQVRYRVVDPATGQATLEDPAKYLAAHQTRKLVRDPDMILELAHRIARRYEARGVKGVQIYALTHVKLNGHPAKPLVDPKVDLARQERSFGHYSWVTPRP